MEQIEDIEELAKRVQGSATDDLAKLAAGLSEEAPVAVGTFHTYKADPAAS